MPTYRIELFEGRSVEQKRKLAEEITRVTTEVLGSAPSPWTSSSPTCRATTGPPAASSGRSKAERPARPDRPWTALGRPAL
jgi:hypothetical protein